MNPYTRITIRIAALFIISLCGCSWTQQGVPSYPPSVSEIIRRFEHQNTAITRANGLASAIITDKDETSRYRLAWAVEKPDRLKMIILFSGKPVETVLYDGKTLAIKSHTQSHELIKRRKKNPNLERLISLSLRINRLIDILSGSIPLPDHGSARLENDPQGGSTLMLFSRKSKPEAVFHLDKDKILSACEFTDKKDNNYHIRYKASGSHEPHLLGLPYEITINNDKKSLHLRIDQLHVNPGLSAETFKMISE